MIATPAAWLDELRARFTDDEARLEVRGAREPWSAVRDRAAGAAGQRRITVTQGSGDVTSSGAGPLDEGEKASTATATELARAREHLRWTSLSFNAADATLAGLEGDRS